MRKVRRIRMNIRMQKAQLAALFLFGKDTKKAKEVLYKNIEELKAMREFLRD